MKPIPGVSQPWCPSSFEPETRTTVQFLPSIRIVIALRCEEQRSLTRPSTRTFPGAQATSLRECRLARS